MSMRLEPLPYTSQSIEEYLSAVNDWSSLIVPNALKGGIMVPAWRLVTAPVGYFGRGILSKKGFISSTLEAIAMLVCLAKIWEYRMREREGKQLIPPVNAEEIRRWKR